MNEEIPVADDWLTDEQLEEVRKEVKKQLGERKLTRVSDIFETLGM